MWSDNMRFYDDLDKAIARLSASKHANPECTDDRMQLVAWLKELKQLRAEKAYFDLMGIDDFIMQEWTNNNFKGR